MIYNIMDYGAAKLKQLLQATVVVRLSEVRMFEGVLIGYDKHLNVVLKECWECRIIDGQLRKEPRGLIVLRGINVETIESVYIPPTRSSGANFFQTGVGSTAPFQRM